MLFTPEKGGYSESHHFKTALNKFDGENYSVYNLQDQFGVYDEWDKFTINMTILALGEREAGVLKTLVIEGMNNYIYMPLWWSRMEMDGVFAGATVSVKDDSLNQNYLEYTEFDFTDHGYTNVRPDVKVFLRSANNIYNHELATLGSVTYGGSPGITLSSSPSNVYVDGDLVIPAVKCMIKKGANLKQKISGILRVNLVGVEL